MSIRLQIEKIDDLRYHLECEPEGHENRISNLKEIASASREVSGTRERQINKLKNLLAQILARLGDSRFRVEITDDVRAEHDRQLEDIRRLKSLYDERLRVLVDMRDAAVKELTDVKDKLKCSRKENAVFEEDLRKAEEKVREDNDFFFKTAISIVPCRMEFKVILEIFFRLIFKIPKFQILSLNLDLLRPIVVIFRIKCQ